LEVLRTLIDQVSSVELKRLKELKHLKELRLDSHSSFDSEHLLTLSMLNGMQLEKLTLCYTERKIPKEILIQISNNYPKLKHIELVNRSIEIVNTILQYFTQLEFIFLDFFGIFFTPDTLVVSDDLKHENLKQLIITNLNTTQVNNTKSLLKLVNACPNLET